MLSDAFKVTDARDTRARGSSALVVFIQDDVGGGSGVGIEVGVAVGAEVGVAVGAEVGVGSSVRVGSSVVGATGSGVCIGGGSGDAQAMMKTASKKSKATYRIVCGNLLAAELLTGSPKPPNVK